MPELTNPGAPGDRLLTAREAREVLRMSKAKFYEVINAGELETISRPTRSGTRCRRFVWESVARAYLIQHTVTTP